MIPHPWDTSQRWRRCAFCCWSKQWTGLSGEIWCDTVSVFNIKMSKMYNAKKRWLYTTDVSAFALHLVLPLHAEGFQRTRESRLSMTSLDTCLHSLWPLESGPCLDTLLENDRKARNIVGVWEAWLTDKWFGELHEKGFCLYMWWCLCY